MTEPERWRPPHEHEHWRSPYETICPLCRGERYLYSRDAGEPGCGCCEFGIAGPHPHELPNGMHINVPLMVMERPPTRPRRTPAERAERQARRRARQWWVQS